VGRDYVSLPGFNEFGGGRKGRQWVCHYLVRMTFETGGGAGHVIIWLPESHRLSLVYIFVDLLFWSQFEYLFILGRTFISLQ
jgi:hypothetical protein